jgi:hypothetical protein
MIPSKADIDRALVVLDSCDLGQLAMVRTLINDLIAAVKTRTAPVRTTDASQPREPWDAVSRAMLYVLFVTSDEYLGALFDREAVH